MKLLVDGTSLLLDFLGELVDLDFLFAGSTDVLKELSHFVRVLARSGHFDRPRPVEVKVAQSVGQMLELHPRQVRVIPTHVEVGWQDTALIRGGRSQIKVELLALRVSPSGSNQPLIDDAAGGRVGQLA